MTAVAAFDGGGGGIERAGESRTLTAAKIGDNEDNNNSMQCGDIFRRDRKRTPQKATESDTY
jgi:hypothetical protein